MKREMSDSDSDDVFNTSPSCSSGGDGSCHMQSRKKRRGIIEKKRRDRINNSLSELRRLVPSAFEKQGSAKLEKAEILQLTVDHLKTMHSKGFDAFSFDPHKYASDYHGIGFRECAAEVARYLVNVEGLDLQDPLRLRLISHLQCFPSHSATAAAASSPSWTSPALPQPSPVVAPPPPSHLVPEQNVFYDTAYASSAYPTHHQLRFPASPAATVSSPYPAYQPNGFPPSTMANPQVKPYRPWGAEMVY